MLEYIVKNSEEQAKIFYLYIIDNEKWLQILEEWHVYFPLPGQNSWGTSQGNL